MGLVISIVALAGGEATHLSRWSDDPHLARMVGSELLQLYKDVYVDV